MDSTRINPMLGQMVTEKCFFWSKYEIASWALLKAGGTLLARGCTCRVGPIAPHKETTPRKEHLNVIKFQNPERGANIWIDLRSGVIGPIAHAEDSAVQGLGWTKCQLLA